MSSTDELLAEIEREDEPSTSESSSSRSRSRSGSGESRRARLASRAETVFSPRAFLAALVLAVGGLFLGGLVPLGFLGPLIGVFTAAFALGLITSDRRYVESAVASGAVVGLSTLLENLTLTFLAGLASGVGLTLAAAAVGGVIGLVGHYFGNDLRNGLTEDL